MSKFGEGGKGGLFGLASSCSEHFCFFHERMKSRGIDKKTKIQKSVIHVCSGRSYDIIWIM